MRCSVDPTYTVFVSGGTLVIGGGTITATASNVNAVAVYVNSGSAEISGGAFTGTVSGYGNGYGIYVNSDGSAKLAGGTFTGNYGAVYVVSGTVGGLLENGYIYCKDGVYASGDSDSLGSGTYTVAECKEHNWSAWSDANDGTHTRTCEYCGKTESAKHDYGNDGQCSDCSAHAAASVKIGEEPIYYGTIEDVWARAKGNTATITLLDDVTVSATLTVSENDNITLTSGTKADDGSDTYTISGDASELVSIKDGTFTLRSGSLHSNGTCVAVYSGTFIMEAGVVDGFSGIQQYDGGTNAPQFDGGTVIVRDGTITGTYGIITAGDSTKLYGGTFTGTSNSIWTPTSSTSGAVGNLLAENCAYRQDGSWVSDTSVESLKGTVTVAKAPIQSVNISPATTTTITYGDTAPTLTATATLVDTSMAVTYQWYQDGTEITGATEATYTPGKLDANEEVYQFTCTATADNYSLTSKAVLVKVDQREAELTITGATTKTYDGTTDGPTGLSIKIENAVSEDDVTVTAESYTYNSADVDEANTITANGVTLSGDDSGNYKLPEGAITTSGTITRSTPVITFLDYSITKTYSGEALNYQFKDRITVSGASIGDVVFSWKDSEGKTLDSAPVNAGTYTIIATIAETKNTAEATNSIQVYILTKTVSNPIITLSPSSYEYDGTAKEPKVTVMDGETEIATSEYVVSYSNNVNVGTDATVTIADAAGGNYEVSGSATFEITKPDLATATVTLTLPDNDYTYDGTTKEPKITVVKDGVTVNENEYTVSYSNTNGGEGNHTNAGTVTVTITATENGNYSGSNSKTFEIKQADISSADVTLTGTRFEYIGGTEIAVQSVVLNGNELTVLTDYTYSGHIGKDTGTYTVTVEGQGNYTGTATAKWEIYQKELTVGNWAIEKAYDGTTDIALDAADAVLYGVCDQDDVKLDVSGVTAQFADAAVSENKSITYTGSFALTGSAAKNYVLKSQPTLTGTITKRPISVTPDSLTKEYGTDDPELTYEITSGSLLAGHTLTLSRADGNNIGSYAINQYKIVNQNDEDVSGNYDVTLANVDFQITKPDLSSATVTLNQTSFTYNGTAQAPEITVKKGEAVVDASEYNVTYSNSNGVDGDHTNAGTITVTITAKETGNYSGSTKSEFVINRADPNIGTVSCSDTIYPTTALDAIGLTRTDTSVPGTLALVSNQSLTVGTKSYNWTFIPQDTANYNTLNGSIELTVVEDTLKSISIGDTAPSKTAYTYGETFDLSGLTVTATYASQNTADVTSQVTFGALSAGQTSVKLTYVEDGIEVSCTVNGITVAKAEQATLNIENTPTAPIPFGSEFTLTTSGGSGDGALTWSVSGLATVDASGKVSVTGVGEITVTVVKAESANYNETTATWTFTSTKQTQATLSITRAPDSVTYGDNAFQLAVSGGSGNGAVTWTITEGNSSASIASDGTVTITGAGRVAVKAVKSGGDDYEDAEADYAFDVAKKPVTAVVTAQNKTYDGNTNAIVKAEVTEGLVNGDSIAITGLTGTFEDKNAGTNKVVQINSANAVISGSSADNYDVSIPATATANIDKDMSAAAPTAGEGYTISYPAETISVKNGYEVSTAQTGGTAVPTGSISDYLGQTLYIRKAEDNNHAASDWTAFTLAARPTAPSLTKTDETLKGQKNGSLSGMNNTMEYSTDGATSWTVCTEAELTGLAGNTTILVRISATDTAPRSNTSSYTIAEGKAITVIFDRNGQEATDMPESRTGLSYQSTIDEPKAPAPVNTDYVFDGWYKDEAGTDKWNFDSDTLTAERVTLYAKWKQIYFAVTVRVTDNDSNAYDSATVTLKRGSETIDTQTGGTNGNYTFSKHVQAGMYNIVVSYTSDGSTQTKTALIEVSSDSSTAVTLPPAGVSSHLDVSADADTPAVMVGGLDEEAAQLKNENNTASKVTVSMEVEGQQETEVANTIVEAIKGAVEPASGQGASVVDYLDVTLTAQIDNDPAQQIAETKQVIELVVPFNFSGRDNVAVVRYHESTAEKLTSANGGTKTDGTYRLDTANGYIHIYTKKFSTYAIAYTTTNTYTITLVTNDGTTDSRTMTTNTSGKLSSLPTLTRDGYTLNGWYTEENGGNQVTKDTQFRADATIYAHWTQKSTGGSGGGGGSSSYTVTVEDASHGTVKTDRTRAGSGTTVTITVTPDEGYKLDELTVTDSRSNELSLTDKGNGKFTFRMPSGKVTVEAVFTAIETGHDCPSLDFTDLDVTAWYHEAVDYALENGMMSGYGSGVFGPNDSLSRAMLCQILYNLEDRPATGQSVFDDVANTAWYADAVTWANANGIVSGYGDGRFGPNDAITREQLAAILWRYARYKGYDTTQGGMAIREFSDYESISDYAVDAMTWAVNTGVVGGYEDKTLRPRNGATRAQVAQMLMNFLKSMS